MLKAISKNIYVCIVLFVLALILDVVVKVGFDRVNYRYLTQPLSLLICIIYYMCNHYSTERNQKLVLTSINVVFNRSVFYAARYQ